MHRMNAGKRGSVGGAACARKTYGPASVVTLPLERWECEGTRMGRDGAACWEVEAASVCCACVWGGVGVGSAPPFG